MKTRAAILTGVDQPFEIVELELDGPKEHEVLVRYVAAGLCHSDLHLARGDFPSRLPIIGGHEGAGVIEEVGPGVTKVRPGDHVLTSFIPSCGQCRYCLTGRANLCDLGAILLDGQLPDGTFRARLGSEEVGAMCSVGSFAQYGTLSEHSVVKIDQSLPLEKAVLASCGVPTGWGSAVNTGNVRPGDTTVIYGSGGVGINAVQGAAAAGARNVVVIDPQELKRDTAMKLGATHAFADAETATEAVIELTRGQGADQAIVLVGHLHEDIIRSAFDIVGKGGTIVITGMGVFEAPTIQLPGVELSLWEKNVKGSLFGSLNPQHDINRLLGLYQAGRLELDALVTREYSLAEVNEGYADLLAGKLIRGVMIHEH
ncbi:NDMA-dependent alcohol dehydrogenase [Nocardia sp. NPDC002869]|uniref:NDMA-dependent alcohol dehydrogenase n=1 Tax=Nocardia sp. NPDC002869 TaxID=3161032 RepID=UPI00398D4858